MDGFVHRHDSFSFLGAGAGQPLLNGMQFLNFYKVVSGLTDRLHAAGLLSALFHKAARGFREMSAVFDRVMLYRFADNYEGRGRGHVGGQSRAPADSPLALVPRERYSQQARSSINSTPFATLWM